ncbi:MAG TPA: glutaredoxin domain-containing protein [Chloroflexia bacterium]|nr:glutaredoxin domain-containing protein [Chloroflexia bacterium]
MSDPLTNDKQIVMYGATWCGDCRRAKKFFDSHGVAYQWIDLEQNPDAVDVVLEQNGGRQVIPTIFMPDGSILVEPSNAQLAEKLGISL